MAIVFEPTAGYLKVEQCVLAHLAAAKMHGCHFLWRTTVQGWTSKARTVNVRTENGDFGAERLVVAAGPWAPHMLGNLGVPLRVLRRHVHWFSSSNPSIHQDAGCPTYLFEMQEGVFYGFPRIDGQGVKVAEHSGGEAVDQPDSDYKQPNLLDQNRVSAFVSNCLSGVGPPIVRRSVCYYTMSPDGHFLVDRHPDQENVVFAAGLSGHGFKFASVLGEVLTGLSLGEQPNPAAGFLRLARLSG
jgi:sarcosine oxidase